MGKKKTNINLNTIREEVGDALFDAWDLEAHRRYAHQTKKLYEEHGRNARGINHARFTKDYILAQYTCWVDANDTSSDKSKDSGLIASLE